MENTPTARASQITVTVKDLLAYIEKFGISGDTEIWFDANPVKSIEHRKADQLLILSQM